MQCILVEMDNFEEFADIKIQLYFINIYIAVQE